ncbi:MAG: hypothetical protein E8D47_02275 [Nitrospira sp.]|nr:MAG: hypothetical protein E8D47_02275 [Nitrospira sp.]
MAADSSDDFQKELIDLFVQEAKEWLQNIHVALDELQQGPAPERHAKLIGTISAGLTNLGGSAATLNLPDVAQVSFEAIPFAIALQDPQKSLSVQDFLSLCKQLGQIHTALTRATGIAFEDVSSDTVTEEARPSLSSSEFLRTLQELQRTKFPDGTAGRNVIRTLIEQVEGQVQAGIDRIDPVVIQGYLVRASEADEVFLRAVDEKIPEIVRNMDALKLDRDIGSSCKMALEASLQDVAQLRTEAQQANASAAVSFFTGLHSLLTVVVQGRALLAATRVDSVKARLQVMSGVARQWVEYEKAQCDAVDRLLPAGHL